MLLDIQEEGEFVGELKVELGISSDHPNFNRILKTWREKHF